MAVGRSAADLVSERPRERREYCLLPQAYSGLPHVIDHVIAQQHDGGDDNFPLACQRCNLLKGRTSRGSTRRRVSVVANANLAFFSFGDDARPRFAQALLAGYAVNDRTGGCAEQIVVNAEEDAATHILDVGVGFGLNGDANASFVELCHSSRL